MIEMRKNVTPGETPDKITVSMIDQDLKDGISKSEMATKYGIKPWEVDEMFKHPFLKGRRPSRKKALSFSFVDDISNQEEDIVDPRQKNLLEAIDEATEEVKKATEIMEETEKEIQEILGPDDQTIEEFVEDLVEKNKTNKDSEVKESWEDERDDLDYANKEPNEEELEDEDDGTFEL